MSADELPSFFRRVFTYIHYSLCFAFFVIIAYSATHGAFATQTGKTPSTPSSISLGDADGQKCLRDLDALLKQLHHHARLQFDTAHEKTAVRSWNDWSEGWRASLASLYLHCRLKSSKDMKPALAYAKNIERVHLSYDNAFRAYFKVGHKASRKIDDWTKARGR